MMTDRSLTKKAIKDGLAKELDLIIKDLRDEMESIHKGVDLDEEDTLDPEDFSHQSEAGDLERSHEQRLKQMIAKRDRLEKLPILPLSEVGIGAVIETKGHTFFISVASRPYEVNARTITPLSMQAPLYEDLKNSKIGDAIVLGPEKETITRIW